MSVEKVSNLAVKNPKSVRSLVLASKLEELIRRRGLLKEMRPLLENLRRGIEESAKLKDQEKDYEKRLKLLKVGESEVNDYKKNYESYGQSFFAMKIKESEIGEKIYYQTVLFKENKYQKAFTVLWNPQSSSISVEFYDDFDQELILEVCPKYEEIFFINLQNHYKSQTINKLDYLEEFIPRL